MHALSRRSATDGPSTSSVSTPTESTELPTWATDISGGRGNAAAVEMVTGDTIREEEASFLLDGSLDQQEEGPEQATPEAKTATPATRPSGKMGRVFDKHQVATQQMGSQATSEHAWSLNLFKRTFAANKGRYESVAAQTGVPAVLVAALHFRESSMDFSTYLHQGDPLGKAAVHVPSNIPIFHNWEKAAVHALNMKSGTAAALNMDESTTDPASLASYAERYNGLGYHNRGKPSPYVYAGTDVYEGGKYVRDGVYDPNVWDRNPGVMALIGSVDGLETSPDWATPQSTEEAWKAVLDGSQVIRHGQRGPAVTALQEKLTAAGYAASADGHFGNGTRKALLAFQVDHNLVADGQVGPKTAASIDGPAPIVIAPETESTATEAETTESTETAAQAPSAGELLWNTVRDGGQLLRKGASGDVVRELQKRLIEAGQQIAVDGSFGPATRRAVIAVQQVLGVIADGIVGKNTAAKL